VTLNLPGTSETLLHQKLLQQRVLHHKPIKPEIFPPKKPLQQRVLHHKPFKPDISTPKNPCSKVSITQETFYTRNLSHQKPLIYTCKVYTRSLWHQDTFTTRSRLHQKPFTPKGFYTWNPGSQKRCCSRNVLHHRTLKPETFCTRNHFKLQLRASFLQLHM